MTTTGHAGPSFDTARAVADAVLFEGYVLYPYRASAQKNRMRWQFGVLMPPEFVAAESSERSGNRTECLVEGRAARLRLRVRFLQVQQRRVEAAAGGRFTVVDRLEAGDTRYVPWDEAVERQVELDVDLAEVAQTPREQTFEVEAGREEEEVTGADGAVLGRLVRSRRALAGAVVVEAVRASGPYGVTRLSVRVENRTGGAGLSAGRDGAARDALVAAHLLLGVEDGAFLSLLDPPEWARSLAEECTNDGTFPVLAGPPGDRSVLLSSPIILYDHPSVAPESETQFFDSTEIDEMLSLRTMTLTEDEQREVRGTDPRAAALLDQVRDMPPDVLDRLHGAVRYLDEGTGPRRVGTPGATEHPEPPAGPDDAPVPWWDPGADTTVSPETDTVDIAGVPVGNGSRVMLRPGKRRADVHDLFLAGRSATVAAVFLDVDGAHHLAVVLDDDPGADLKRAHGRYLYFAPDEVEPLGVDS